MCSGSGEANRDDARIPWVRRDSVAHSRSTALGFGFQRPEDAIDATLQDVAAVLLQDPRNDASKRFGRARSCAPVASLELKYVDGVDPHGDPCPPDLARCINHLQGRNERRRTGLPAERRTRLKWALERHRFHVGVPRRPGRQVDHHRPHGLRWRRNLNLAFGGCGRVPVDIHRAYATRL